MVNRLSNIHVCAFQLTICARLFIRVYHDNLHHSRLVNADINDRKRTVKSWVKFVCVDNLHRESHAFHLVFSLDFISSLSVTSNW